MPLPYPSLPPEIILSIARELSSDRHPDSYCPDSVCSQAIGNLSLVNHAFNSIVECEIYKTVWIGTYERFGWFYDTVMSRAVEAECEGGRPPVNQYIHSLGISFYDDLNDLSDLDSLLLLLLPTLQRLYFAENVMGPSHGDSASASRVKTASTTSQFSKLRECAFFWDSSLHNRLYKISPTLHRIALYRNPVSEEFAHQILDSATTTSEFELKELYLVNPKLEDASLPSLFLLLLNLPNLQKIILFVPCDVLYPVTCFRYAARFRKALAQSPLAERFGDRIFISEMITRYSIQRWMSDAIRDGNLWSQDQVTIFHWIQKYPIEGDEWQLGI